MSGFPMVPRFTNNTDDDDNSIHLKHNIGKANPLRSPTKRSRNNHNNEVFSYNNNNHNSDVSIDEKIAKIISNSKTSIRENGNDIIDNLPNGEYNQEKQQQEDEEFDDDDEEELDEFDTNKSYLKFLNGELQENHEDDEYILSDGDTFNEESLESNLNASGYEDEYLSDGDLEFDSDRFKEKNIFNDDDNNDNLTKELRHRYPRTRSNKLKFGSLSPSPSLSESDEIDLVNSQLSNPPHNNDMNWKQYIIISLVSFLMTILGYLLITGQISTILPNLLPISGSFDPIKMAKLDGKLHRLDQELKNSHQKQQETLFQLQSQIDQLNNKIISIIDNQQQQQQQQSSRNNEDKSTTTTNKKHEDIITLENNQIQISPEFHQFLYKFIDNYQNSYLDEKLQQLEKFNDLQQLQNYVEKLISMSMESIKQDIRIDIDNILDNLTTAPAHNNHTVIVNPKTNKLWINSILDLITQGTSSTSINYADYSTGARILGFLTSSSTSSSSSSHHSTPSILQKMIYGWWIYKSNFYQDEYNANHVLLDDDIVWKGGDQIGIRLSTNIIPTDIILECRDNNNNLPSTQTQGILLSIGFKPSTKNGFDKLSKIPLGLLNSHGQLSMTSSSSSSLQLPNQNENKYISKFKLINNIILNLLMVVVFINLQISGKDLYFKFDKIIKDNNDNINTIDNINININNIKVYGINEINAIKYQDKFQLLIDKFIDIEENDHNEQISTTTTTSKVIEINNNEKSSLMDFMTSRNSEKYQQQYDMNDDIYL
ncbi:hypothetical protein FOB64_002570 [Candida albicans]|uniref:SUN domain-containing protein n=1 Tax=Candida albicans TaxID=5476 RepID=A0A8H6BXV9_CANAX|nr:hypothetical protein FOB64_002570 [Candida albicans]